MNEIHLFGMNEIQYFGWASVYFGLLLMNFGFWSNFDTGFGGIPILRTITSQIGLIMSGAVFYGIGGILAHLGMYL